MLNNLFNMPLVVILLFSIFVLTAVRKIGKYEFPIWLLFTIAAIISLISGKIGVADALYAVDFNIIFYLLGVFIIGAALEKSNYLEYIMLKFLKNINSANVFLGCFIFLCSASTLILMNDTVAIIGVPTIILLCKITNFPPLPLFLTLAYSLTISSVCSPIANPQNLLIANELASPFVSFLYYLFVPTTVNCCILFAFMRVCFKDVFKQTISIKSPVLEVDQQLANLSKISICIMLFLISIQIICSLANSWIQLPFSLIALISASPIIIFYKKRIELASYIDWHTLVFFVSIFIFIESVWISGYFQTLIRDLHLPLTKPLTITTASLLLSQLISNVPLVVLYLPFLNGLSEQLHMMLAMASTMAGNLFILGAASNVIIVQNSAKRGVKAFSFLQFSCYGIPLTIINVAVFYGWLYFY